MNRHFVTVDPFCVCPKFVGYDTDAGDIIQIKYNTTNGYGYPNYGHNLLVTSEVGYAGSANDILITCRKLVRLHTESMKF